MPTSWKTRMAVAAVAVGLAASAAPAGIAVSPLKQDVLVKPGAAATFHVTVANRTRGPDAKPCSAHLAVVDFQVTELGAVLLRPPATVKNSASQWITPTKATVTLKPDQAEKVAFTVKAPYAAVGEYYSAVLVTLDQKRTHGEVEVDYRIASGVFVTIPGRTFPKKAQVLRCELAWLRPADAPPTSPAPETPTIVAILKNTGQARFEASGHVRISNDQGRTVFKAPMTTRRARVLAGDTRQFECVLAKALPHGQYTMRVEFDYQSGWTKAQTRVPLTISADREALLAAAAAGTTAKAAGPAFEVAPKTLAAKVPAGAFRILKLAVKNTGNETLQCRASVADPTGSHNPASWFHLEADTFALPKARTKTLYLAVRVPAEAVGLHKTDLILEIGEHDAMPSRIEVPIALTVKGGTG